MKSIYIRNISFGIADSLVSTVGLLSGISISGTPRSIIIVTGIVYAFVEAFSMAVGSFLSEQSTREFEQKNEVRSMQPVIGSVTMFAAFVFSSLIPILPYFFVDSSYAIWISIFLSIAALFLVGMIIARVSHTRILNHGVKMMVLGGAAIIIGVVVGKLVKIS